MNRTYIYIICCLLFFGAAAQKGRRTGLVNGVAHIGNGRVIEKSIIVINQSTIELVADMTTIRIDLGSFDTLIDLAGRHVYPAMINANNILGLHDAEAVRATVDFSEVGSINPHIRALIAYNTDNVIIPTVRTNGVLYTQVTPRGGLISGSSSVMALEGWNWEDAVLRADDGIHLNFPKMAVNKFVSADAQVTRNVQKKYGEDMARLDDFFTESRAYFDLKDPQPKNIRFEAMRAVFAGSANLYLHADRVKDVMSAIGFARKHQIKKPVLVGCQECAAVSSDLRRYRIPVMLGRINDLPFYTDDDIDAVNRLPYRLLRDSVLFCLQMEGDMEAMNSRNLPFNAGVTVAYGLSKEAALASVTSSVARILGIDRYLGTLEEGKLASLVVSEGDLLDMRTNNITLAFLSGKPVKLDNRQTELFLKYKTKYGIE